MAATLSGSTETPQLAPRDNLQTLVRLMKLKSILFIAGIVAATLFVLNSVLKQDTASKFGLIGQPK